MPKKQRDMITHLPIGDNVTEPSEVVLPMVTPTTTTVPMEPIKPEPIRPLYLPNPAILTTPNDNMITHVMRRVRELVVDAQQRRGDGKIFMELYVNAGMLTKSPKVGYNCNERLG